MKGSNEGVIARIRNQHQLDQISDAPALAPDVRGHAFGQMFFGQKKNRQRAKNFVDRLRTVTVLSARLESLGLLVEASPAFLNLIQT
jgi:hypothetical protein